MPPIYFLLPVLTALTGWIVVLIFWKFLFHPVKPLNLMGVPIQGVFPAQKQKQAKQLANLAGEKLFTLSALEEKVTNPELFQQLMPLIDSHLDDFLRNKLGQKMPMISMFIGEKTILQLKETFVAELNELFPVILKNYLQNLQSGFDLTGLIEEKINNLSTADVELYLKQKMRRQLFYAQLLAASIGLVIGLLALAGIWIA